MHGGVRLRGETLHVVTVHFRITLQKPVGYLTEAMSIYNLWAGSNICLVYILLTKVCVCACVHAQACQYLMVFLHSPSESMNRSLPYFKRQCHEKGSDVGLTDVMK